MPTSPDYRNRDEIARGDKAIWQEAADRLKIAIEAETLNRQQGIEDLEFVDGQQWPDDLYNFRKLNKRPSLTINHTQTFCRRIVNNLREQRPRIKVHAVGQAAVEDAKVISGLIRHIEYRSNASVAYDYGAEFAVNLGWGYWRVVSEWEDEKSFMQELRVLPIVNPFTVYMDPSAVMPDGSDQLWCLISEKLKRIDYRRLYPDDDPDQFENLGPGDALEADWQSVEEIRLAEYFRVVEKKATLYRLTSGAGIWPDEWEDNADRIKAVGHDLVRDKKGAPVERPSTRRTIEWYRLNGTRVIDQREIPGHWIPIVRCQGNVLNLNGQMRRKGAVRDMRDPARMFNYWRTAMTEKLALSPKAPWVGAEGQFDGHPEWEDANQKPYSRLEYKPVLGPDGHTVLPPPQRQPAVELDAGFVQAAESAEHDLLAVAGMPHEPRQDEPGSVVSGVALRRRQALSDISHFQYFDNQTQSIAHTGRILLDLIPHYYGEQRMQRIVGEDGVPSMVMLNQRIVNPQTKALQDVKYDLSVGKFEVVMDTGPGYESKRQEAAEAVVDLMRTPLGEVVVKTGPDIILRNLDFPGSDELANRALPMSPQGLQKALAGMSDEARAVATAMQQQIMQLQAQNQQLSMQLKFKTDIEHGWMAVELEKARVKEQGAERDTHVKAQTAHNVEETRAATDILVERMKQGHDERMAGSAQLAASLEAERGRAHESSEAERNRQSEAARAAKSNGGSNG